MVIAGNHELSLDPSTWEEASEYMDQAGEARQSTEQVKTTFLRSLWGTGYGTYMEQAEEARLSTEQVKTTFLGSLWGTGRNRLGRQFYLQNR